MSAPEHDFGEDVVVSGDNLRAYSADGTIEQHQAVEISGDYEVSAIDTAGDEGDGVAAFDVVDGQSVTVAGDNTEVRVEAGTDGATAGENATVDADGNFVDAGSGDAVWGTFNTGGADGEFVELALDTEKEVAE